MNVTKVVNLSAAAKTWNGLDVLTVSWNNTSNCYGIGIFLNGKCYIDGNVLFYHPSTTFWTWGAGTSAVLCEEAVIRHLGIGEITSGASFSVEVRTYGDLNPDGSTIDQSKYASETVSYVVPSGFTTAPVVNYSKSKGKK